MSKLHLIRHGPTHAKTMVGWSDLPADLSDHGALARLRSALPDEAVMVSSDLIRASATADAVSSGQLRLPNQPELREINFGDWELKSFDQINADDPDRVFEYFDSPGTATPPNGENWLEFSARINAAVDGLMAAHQGKELIIVVHFGVIISQIQRAEGASPKCALRHAIDNLSLTQISFENGTWDIHRINYAA